MAGRLAIDFGTSNTVVAVWDESRQKGVPFHLGELGHWASATGETSAADGRVSVVPSLIHYASDGSRWLGAQVLNKNLYDSPRTFRWMKRAIANRHRATVQIDGQAISAYDAGRDFLASVLMLAVDELNIRGEEIALTVPVEAFEHYADWLATVAERAGLTRFRLIDEPSAAALGYGTHIQSEDVYTIVDFGGGTLDVAVVLIEEEESAAAGRRCRVLGKAGEQLGGMNIDQWLFQEVLRRNGRRDSDEEIRAISRALLVECERAKEHLSFHQKADITVLNPHTGSVLAAEVTRSELEELLDRHEMFTRITQTIRRAISDARERGYDEEQIKAMLLVGGSCQIPCVQKTIQRIFGRERVHLNRPLDAVARGAAAFVAGVDFYDHIQHDYAIQYHDAKKGRYEYRILVKRGTPYPTKQAVAKLKIKATNDGQTQLGIAIYELGETRPQGTQAAMELVFDASGAARVVEVTADAVERRSKFWMNEDNPTFLPANPPARAGETRFEVEFHIDGNKRLLITARDLKTGRLTHKDFPVVKLT